MEDVSARILVVDDDKAIRVTVTQALENVGYQAVSAVDGEHALSKFSQATFDLVLLDMKMPGMDGIEVLRRIKEIEPMQSVIMVTGYGTVETAVEAMKLGAVDYIQKPFTPDEIRAMVRRVLSRRHLDEKRVSSPAESLELAKKYLVEKNIVAAEKHIRNVIGTDPTNPEPFYLLGILCELKGNVEQAQKMYRVALALDPSYVPARENLDRTVQFGRRGEQLKLDHLLPKQDDAGQVK